MPRLKDYDRSQGLFLTVNLEEQLLPGTFEWALDYLIDRMDLSLFVESYHNDEMGARAYSPKILLKTIMYCYSLGIVSSCPIEKACRTNYPQEKEKRYGARPRHHSDIYFQK
jgi:transposase